MRQNERAILVFLGASASIAACTDVSPPSSLAHGGAEAPEMGQSRAGSGNGDVREATGAESSNETNPVFDGRVETGATEPRNGSDTGSLEEPGERIYELRLHDDPPPVTLELSREEVAAVFGDRAREVLLIELDPTALLTESLERIKEACGPSWAEDDPDPRHDCTLTELGRTFAGPDGSWQSSAQYALVRILTMTPANVDVSGTSSESLRALADSLGIGGGYSQILADALGIARTEAIVSTEALVQALGTHFIASHPNAGGDGRLAITLEDALTDLATLAERYGPQGAHPGVIDPSLPPSGAVLGPDFDMRVVASSNWRQCDGVDADSGQRIVSVVVDETGPTFEDALEFDFEDPARFNITGVADTPAVSLRFRIREESQFVPSCLGARCQANSPGTPVGNRSVWAIAPWLLEHNVAAAARNDYIDRTFEASYLFGLASVSLGRNGNPPGWVSYDVPLDIGSPPEDQYVWETVLEVAQVSLHQTPFASIPEGEVEAVFTLADVPIGLTGAQLAQQVRPYLQEQNGSLSDLLLPDGETASASVDFYYCRAGSGAPYLFFIGEADMTSGEPYPYEHPGFFRTSTLEDKLSSREVLGVFDTRHEKLPIVEGERVVHFEDDRGVVYRARIVRDAGSDQIAIHIAPTANRALPP
jgi:hypothetical protein